MCKIVLEPCYCWNGLHTARTSRLCDCFVVLFWYCFFVERVCTERKLGECVIVLLFCCLHVIFLSKRKLGGYFLVWLFSLFCYFHVITVKKVCTEVKLVVLFVLFFMLFFVEMVCTQLKLGSAPEAFVWQAAEWESSWSGKTWRKTKRVWKWIWSWWW